MRTETIIHQRYRPGYHYKERLWKRRVRSRAKLDAAAPGMNFIEHGQLQSPRGQVWRFCGTGGTGMRLLRVDFDSTGKERLTLRDVDYDTIHRALLLGWSCKMDKKV